MWKHRDTYQESRPDVIVLGPFDLESFIKPIHSLVVGWRGPLRRSLRRFRFRSSIITTIVLVWCWLGSLVVVVVRILLLLLLRRRLRLIAKALVGVVIAGCLATHDCVLLDAEEERIRGEKHIIIWSESASRNRAA